MPIRLSNKLVDEVASTMAYHSFPLVRRILYFFLNYATVVSTRHQWTRA